MVNNAGYTVHGDTEAIPEDAARKVVETLLWGTIRLSIHAIRVM
jgi:NAD(P)-dependent dehydrogenase (short-subunit alcohol dehydrogenase family)